MEAVLGLDPPAEVAARAIAELTSAVCGVSAVPATLSGRAVMLFPCREGWDMKEVAAAIALERVTPAWVAPDGRIAVAVGWGYGATEQQQIVKAIAKVLHGLCEIHTTAINAIEAGYCPRPPQVAAWPWELAAPVLSWLAAAGAWLEAGHPTNPDLAGALAELDAEMRSTGSQ